MYLLHVRLLPAVNGSASLKALHNSIVKAAHYDVSTLPSCIFNLPGSFKLVMRQRIPLLVSQWQVQILAAPLDSSMIDHGSGRFAELGELE
jgi:hypothetical protein